MNDSMFVKITDKNGVEWYVNTQNIICLSSEALCLVSDNYIQVDSKSYSILKKLLDFRTIDTSSLTDGDD